MSWSAVEWAKRVRIAGRAKQLLETYASRSNDCDKTCVSVQRVAREWMCSERTVERAKAALLAQGLISVTKRYLPDGTRTSDEILLHIRELPDVMPARAPRDFGLHDLTCAHSVKPQVRSSRHGCRLNNNPPTPHGPSAAGTTVVTAEDGEESSPDNRPSDRTKHRETPKRAARSRSYHEHPRLDSVMGEVEPMLLKVGGFGGNRPKFRREVNVALFSGWDPFALVTRLCASYAGADQPWAVAFSRVREEPPLMARVPVVRPEPSMGSGELAWFRERASVLRGASSGPELVPVAPGLSASEEWVLARRLCREAAGRRTAL